MEEPIDYVRHVVEGRSIMEIIRLASAPEEEAESNQVRRAVLKSGLN